MQSKLDRNGYIQDSIEEKILYTKTRDKEAFKSDLEWVTAQDPHKADSPYPANAYFQREARELLAHIDDYF